MGLQTRMRAARDIDVQPTHTRYVKMAVGIYSQSTRKSDMSLLKA